MIEVLAEGVLHGGEYVFIGPSTRVFATAGLVEVVVDVWFGSSGEDALQRRKAGTVVSQQPKLDNCFMESVRTCSMKLEVMSI